MSMREKCARALCKEAGVNPDAMGTNDFNKLLGVLEASDKNLVGGHPCWKFFLPAVDAVLDVLMEPTEEMIEAGRFEAETEAHVFSRGFTAAVRAAHTPRA